MKKTKINTMVERGLADFITPVTAYLKLRDHFRRPVLLESNDFTNKEVCFSYIGLDPIATFEVKNQKIKILLPGDDALYMDVIDQSTVPSVFKEFLDSLEVADSRDLPFTTGLFGHTNFESVGYFDTHTFDEEKAVYDIPDMHYDFYRYVITFNHYKDEYYLIENTTIDQPSDLSKVSDRLFSHSFQSFDFAPLEKETSNLTDEQFRNLVTLGKHHCQMGDVFQIVFSRQFRRQFSGDEFNVYRILRSINPSPYLFYFDLGSYKIMGSSPEAQMVIKGDRAIVNPIAGTYKRTGVVQEDLDRADALSKDPKENAEHIMLVDLARNDLGRHAESVEVKELKQIHFYSHVMHLVSTVEGHLPANANPIQIFGDTFPAGTLSGAPKYRAIELIAANENQQRGYYGGAIGIIDLNGNMNQAILIRSFLSQDNTLFYQAGAGVVVSSDEEKELQEVNNKLGALTRAIELAKDI